MAKKYQLKERDTGENILPITSTECVIDGEGVLSDNLLLNMEAEEVLNKPTREEIGTLTREELKKDLFIDMWNKACNPYVTRTEKEEYGGYYPNTTPSPDTPFLLNGIWLTYDEAVEIYNYGWLEVPYHGGLSPHIKTNLLRITDLGGQINALTVVRSNTYGLSGSNIRILRIAHNRDRHITLDEPAYFIYSMPYVEEVLGNLSISKGGTIIYGCPKLREIRLRNLKANNTKLDAPLLSLESFQFLIDNASNTTAITVKIHEDVYSKLTDPNNTEWYALNELALSKQITFATV